MKCFYHSADLDGQASGAIIAHVFNCETIGINYGEVFPFEILQPKEVVFMVDFTLQPFEEMEKLEKWSMLTWIDHHKTAIEEAEKRQFNPLGIRRIGIGACALTWEFFETEPMPEAIKLLAEYDVWNHSDPRTLPFQYGFRFFENTKPENQDFWISFLEGDVRVDYVCELGEILMANEERQGKKYCEAYAFETRFGEHLAICVNRGMTNAKIFDSVYDPIKHDLMITFCRMKLPAHQWTVSLYSTKEDVDCGGIAQLFGGGGHKGAAGFQCAVLPFEY